jgi:hypothetical protein
VHHVLTSRAAGGVGDGIDAAAAEATHAAMQQARQLLRLLVDRCARVPGMLLGDYAAQFVDPELNTKLWSLTAVALEDLHRCIHALAMPADLKPFLDAANLLIPKNGLALARATRRIASGDARDEAERRVLDVASHPLLRSVSAAAPHMLPFALRAEFMRCFMANDRRLRGVQRVKAGFKIRRSRLLDDSYLQIMGLVDTTVLRARFHIEFLDDYGRAEAGIDAGGVFKEFIDLVAKRVFDPNLGLFRKTESQGGFLYPSPTAEKLFGPEWRVAFRFAGRVIAKAIYEGVLLPVRLAPFSLNAILGRGCTIDDLRLLDEEHYRSLLRLKEMPDVSVAGLVFVDDEVFMGETVEHELVPNGGNVEVTNDNLIRYLHLLAYHRLVGRTAAATACIVEGLKDILDMHWLKGFSAPELQQAISGRSDEALAVDDLAAHTKLVGYAAGDRPVKLLWEVLQELSDDDRSRFLAFCTGSSRPPLLGFETMQPPFTVARADTGEGSGGGSLLNYVVDIDRLPSASTCFNLLKLPPYRSKANLKEKLLVAIRSDSGFQLS